MLNGIYLPDMITLDYAAAATGDVFQANPVDQSKASARGPVCVVSASVTGSGGAGTVKVERGTWDGLTFTATQTIGYAAATTGLTSTDFIGRVVNAGSTDAIRVTVSANAIAFVRIQGVVVKVH